MPEFRLQAVLRHAPELDGKPAALVEATGTKSRILESGTPEVKAGMTVTQAMARCPGLLLCAPNPAQEASAQDILLQVAERLSPFLESTAPGVVTVELPREKDFAPEDFRLRLIDPLESLGLKGRVGVAPNPGFALLVARHAAPVAIVEEPRAFLDPLPVADLDPLPELLAVLGDWGIRTVGELVALPMADVVGRLGREAVVLWERARGGRSRPLDLVRARAVFEEKADLDHPVETLEPLLFLLRRFLDQLSRRLGQAYLVAARLRLVLRFDDGVRHEKDFAIPAPTRNADLLFRMLHTHLETVTAPAPIVGLDVEAKPARPVAEQFGLLERGLKDPHQFAETLARLQALVGADRVGQPRVEDSHRPDAFSVEPYEETPLSSAPLHPLIGLPLLRFRPPLSAEVDLDRERRPAYVRSSRFEGLVAEVLGPWKLRGNWWDLRAWASEEWDVATPHGFYRMARTGDRWSVEGIYG
ncbi:MAG TPA: DNA polymerase Y family protein [Candidatus Methylacidiphilales bacterium]